MMTMMTIMICRFSCNTTKQWERERERERERAERRYLSDAELILQYAVSSGVGVLPRQRVVVR